MSFIAQHITTSGEAELENLTLYRLMKTFQKVMGRYKYLSKKEHHTIVQYKYTMEGQRNFIIHFIKKKNKISFREIFETAENRIHAVFSFLAILELISQDILQIRIGEGINNFYLSAK